MATNTTVAIKTSPFEVRRMTKLPPELEAKKKGKRTSYPWHELKRKGDFIEVTNKQYPSAMASAENWVSKQNAELPEDKHIAVSSMIATDDDGRQRRHEVIDEATGQPVTLKTGKVKTEPDAYWIIRIK